MQRGWLVQKLGTQKQDGAPGKWWLDWCHHPGAGDCRSDRDKTTGDAGASIPEHYATVVGMLLRTAGNIGRFRSRGCCNLTGVLLRKLRTL